MALIPLTFENDGREVGEIIMAGLDSSRWTIEADARIRTSADPVGIGPVVYTGRTENPETGNYSSDGVVRDAMFLFFLADGVRRAEFFDEDPDDLTETVADFLANHGGDVTAMSALAPTVA